MAHEHEQEVVPFAQTNFRGKSVRFGIKTDDRRRHVYLIGKTGMGKTSMLEQLAYHDIQAGHGVAYLDPHGDTADKLLSHIPNSRINDVIYFNPADLDWPVAFNVLEHVDGNQKHLVASGLIGIFKKIWSDSWGPRLEYVLRNAILALMDYPGTTLLGIMRILVDKEYRRKVVAKVQDPVVKSFWIDEYARYPDKFQTEAIAPIQNKVGQFLSSPLVRNIVGQVKSTIHIREIMDNRKILIMNLAKGGVGEDNSALLGAMMVTKLYLGAMERVSMPEQERRDFYLYVDEFQNFATDSFADILSEARKYRLNLIIAHQYVGQLMTDTSTRVRDAVFGNVGTLVSFRVGAQDAEFLEPEFMPVFTQEDLVNLPKWSVYLKLMINGVASQPFSAGTLAPLDAQYQPTGNREKVLRSSRERFATPRSVIEDKIARWTGMVPEDEAGEGGASVDEGADDEAHPARERARELTRDLPKQSPGSTGSWLRHAGEATGRVATSGDGAPRQRETHMVECASCGGAATVYFKPRPGQRILCENCMRAEKERQKMAEIEGKVTPNRKPARAGSRGPPRSQSPRPAQPTPPKIDDLEIVERGGPQEVSLNAMLGGGSTEERASPSDAPRDASRPPRPGSNPSASPPNRPLGKRRRGGRGGHSGRRPERPSGGSPPRAR